MGIDMHISLNSFHVYLGVVNSKNISKPEFQSRLEEFDSKFKAETSWAELTNQEVYNSNDSKSSFLKMHPQRFIQTYTARSRKHMGPEAPKAKISRNNCQEKAR
ncbi:hypothetical protein M5689_020520 [Euphorbia peplus]|nr:hypothetical protein M5689_020520 [Euphorbia peplus]